MTGKVLSRLYQRNPQVAFTTEIIFNFISECSARVRRGAVHLVTYFYILLNILTEW